MVLLVIFLIPYLLVLLFSIDFCDLPESKAVTEKEIRIRNEIVRKMRRKLMNDANWRGSSGRRRLLIRRLGIVVFFYYYNAIRIQILARS